MGGRYGKCFLLYQFVNPFLNRFYTYFGRKISFSLSFENVKRGKQTEFYVVEFFISFYLSSKMWLEPAAGLNTL